MPKPWTSHLIRDALGVKKCNGSMEAATEDLPLEKAIEVAKKKHGEANGKWIRELKVLRTRSA